ncbi:MAG: Lon protease-like protein [Planctomycetota bacterium]
MSQQNPIPDGWPPKPGPERTVQARVMPMFPLPGVFLHPRQIMPLNIFEPRYRSMIEDCLDGPGRIVIGTILEPDLDRIYDEDDPPRILSVAGMGEIAGHERAPDGRFHIWLVGLGRVIVEEAPRDTPYRKVKALPLLEMSLTTEDAKSLEGSLKRAILARQKQLPEGSSAEKVEGQEQAHKGLQNSLKGLPAALLVDVLSPRLRAPQAELERIFSEPDVLTRARLALRLHAAYPPEQP